MKITRHISYKTAYYNCCLLRKNPTQPIEHVPNILEEPAFLELGSLLLHHGRRGSLLVTLKLTAVINSHPNKLVLKTN